MSKRDKALLVLGKDFAILTTIIGSWFLFVMGGSSSAFGDLTKEANLVKLSIGIVAWIVLYAQHFRVTGDISPPDPIPSNSL